MNQKKQFQNLIAITKYGKVVIFEWILIIEKFWKYGHKKIFLAPSENSLVFFNKFSIVSYKV